MKQKNDSIRDGLQELYQEDSESESKENLSSESAAEVEEEGEIYFNPEAELSKKNKTEDRSALALNPKKPKEPKNALFKKLVIFLLFACLIGVGVLIWQAHKNLTQPETLTSKKVKLEITGPKEIISGEPTEYKITLENKSGIALKDSEVTVRFSSNFILKESEPEPENLLTPENQPSTTLKIAQYFWQIPHLPSGSKKEITVLGQIFSEIGSKQIITASCHYQPENFSSDFKTSSILEVEISDTLVSLEIDAPTEIVDNAEIEYQIKISQSSKISTSTKNLKVFIEYPQGFMVSSVKPETNKEEEQECWLFDNLEDEQIINIKGTLTGESGEYKELMVRAGYYIDDEFQLQAGESFITMLIKPELDFALKVNNLGFDYSADWGDEIEYSLTYANAGQVDLSDVILKLNFSGNDIIDWMSINCEQDGTCDFILATSPDNSTKTLIWTREQLRELEVLKPGQSGNIKLNLNLKEQSPVESKENYYSTVGATADVKVEGLADSQEFESNKIILKIRTQAILETEARYYTDEGLKIGSGPLPPLVGAATSFRIFWQIDNTSNALENIKVTTTLPENVSWGNRTQNNVGELKFNSYNRQVTWNIPDLAVYSYAGVSANFEITVTPTLSQIGEYLTLTKETILEATDIFTKDSISAYAGYLTSELENDLYGMGKGRVE